jgi:hypothetical protein
LYWGSLRFGFINYDDYTILLNQARRFDEHSLLRSLERILVLDFPREEPLIVRDIAWAVESRLFGLNNPFGFHLGNVLVNALSVALAFRFLLRATGKLNLAALSAVLFAVWPVHVQPVCWVSGEKDLLVALFTWLALIVQCAAIEHTGTRRGRMLDVLVLLLLIFAIFSKFSAVILFLLFALRTLFAPHLDGSRAPDAPLEWNRLRPALPVLCASVVIVAVVYYWYNKNLTLFGVLVDRGPATLSVEHLETLSRFIPAAIAMQLQRVFWPFQYSIAYLYPNVNLGLSAGELIAGYATLVGLLAVLGYTLRKRKDLAFHVLACLVLLLPYLNIRYIGIWAADRYAYSATLFIGALVVQLGLDAAARIPRARAPLCLGFAALVAFYGVQNVGYQQAWRDNLSFWRHEVALDRPSVLAWSALGKELLARARSARTQEETERYLAEAQYACTHGLARYDALGIGLTFYRAPERLHAANMEIVLGEIAQMEAKPLSAQLPHFERAYTLAISQKSAFMLADAYMKLADEAEPAARESLIRTSFLYFSKYVELRKSVDASLTRSEFILKNLYERRFPFLAKEIAELRARYLQ